MTPQEMKAMVKLIDSCTELACQEWIKSIVYTYSQSPCWIYENVDIGQVTNENEFEIIRIEDNV